MAPLQRLKNMASEYWQPMDLLAAVAWALSRLEALEQPAQLLVPSLPSPIPTTQLVDLPNSHC